MITVNIYYTNNTNNKPCNKLSLFFNSSNTECRWVSIPFATYYDKTFKNSGEAIEYLNSKSNTYYEIVNY